MFSKVGHLATDCWIMGEIDRKLIYVKGYKIIQQLELKDQDNFDNIINKDFAQE